MEAWSRKLESSSPACLIRDPVSKEIHIWCKQELVRWIPMVTNENQIHCSVVTQGLELLHGDPWSTCKSHRIAMCTCNRTLLCNHKYVEILHMQSSICFGGILRELRHGTWFLIKGRPKADWVEHLWIWFFFCGCLEGVCLEGQTVCSYGVLCIHAVGSIITQSVLWTWVDRPAACVDASLHQSVWVCPVCPWACLDTFKARGTWAYFSANVKRRKLLQGGDRLSHNYYYQANPRHSSLSEQCTLADV